MTAGGLDGVVASIRSNIPVKMLAVGAMLFIPFSVFGVFVAALFCSAAERMFTIGLVTEKRIAIAIAVYVIVLLWAHDAVASTIIALQLMTKAVMVILAIFPLGIFLGQLFPRGLKAAHAHDRRLVPWTWAVNGTMSTIFVGVGFVLSYPMGLSFLIYLGAAFVPDAFVAAARPGAPSLNRVTEPRRLSSQETF